MRQQHGDGSRQPEQIEAIVPMGHRHAHTATPTIPARAAFTIAPPFFHRGAATAPGHSG